MSPVTIHERSAGLRVDPSVARGTQGDQIVLRIITRLAPQLYVVDFESAQRAASLATPAIPFEDFLVQSAINISVQPNAVAFS